MSTTLATAATLLALIFSAPVLCAAAPRIPVEAAVAGAALAGQYKLTGPGEVGSVLQLMPDGSFQWDMWDGAAEQFAKGRWSVEGNQVVLVDEQLAGQVAPAGLGTQDGFKGMVMQADDGHLRVVEPQGWHGRYERQGG